MKKISAIIAVSALVVAFAVVGCSKSEAPKTEPQSAPSSTVSAPTSTAAPAAAPAEHK